MKAARFTPCSVKRSPRLSGHGLPVKTTCAMSFKASKPSVRSARSLSVYGTNAKVPGLRCIYGCYETLTGQRQIRVQEVNCFPHVHSCWADLSGKLWYLYDFSGLDFRDSQLAILQWQRVEIAVTRSDRIKGRISYVTYLYRRGQAGRTR